jgi:hypothetical protein
MTHQQPLEQQDLDRLRDKLAKGWAAGQTKRQIGKGLGLTKGAVVGMSRRS